MRERLGLGASIRQAGPMRAVLTLCLLLAAGPALAASADWRRDATRQDNDRVDRLAGAWTSALKAAKRSNGAEVRSLGVLADPKAGLENPEPAPGLYRCRTIKLGDKAGFGLPYVAYGWFRCHIELSSGGDLTLRKLTGSQRTSGHLYPMNRKRLAYLGAEAWGDGEGPLAYGENPERDQAGVFDRIGPQRYRLVLPWPKYESELDIIELVPAG
jgi:hypothetical protein